jgi:hypothetical protein
MKLTKKMLKDIIQEEVKKLSEDDEAEETYNYGEDEGEDRKKEDKMKEHIAGIDHHLDALKKDMGYDEDHERRHEKDTDFE